MADDYESTNSLVTERFDLSEQFASDAIQSAEQYMSDLNNILQSLSMPNTSSIGNIQFPTITPIDYNAMPQFSQTLQSFPSFNNQAPSDPIQFAPQDVSVTFPQDNINFTANTYSMPSVNIPSPPPDNTNLQSITIPSKPSYQMPTAPTLSSIVLPSAPNINLPSFTATAPSIGTQNQPQGLNYSESPYNSDIRVDLFGKILDDLKNGGTGLDATVEDDLYERGRERQRVENERLYREVEDQFSATGFGLPSGAYASRILEVSNEISRKLDQTNREITINQAELAQKNTQFTVEQAAKIEGLLMDFFNQQENRTLDAAKATAQNAIDVYNSVVEQQRLKLEKYQAEAAVFEQQIRAELSAVEIYKAEVEATKVKGDVQQSQVNVYKAQIEGIATLIDMYATEMQSAKVQADTQTAQIEVFKAQTEAYTSQVAGEKTKVDIYKAQQEGEQARAQAYAEEVRAYQTKVEAKRSEAEIQKYNADITLKENQTKLDEYRAKIEGYKAELETEIKNAQLEMEGFKAQASAYEVQTNAKGMEYQTQIQEIQAKIEKAKGQLQKQVAEIEAVHGGYVSLKTLQAESTKGMMNANTELAASALNAVNVSAGQSHSYDHSWSESERISETHSYEEKCC